MAMEFIFASLAVAYTLFMFHKSIGIVYYLAASTQTDWLAWWSITLLTMVFLAAILIMARINKE